MTNTICLDEKYSTTRLLCKIVNDECLMLNEDGRIKEDCKWNINNSELNIKNSKLIGNPDDKFETVLFLPEGEGRKGEGGLRTKGYFKKSYENKPLISIITVVFNGEKYLEETIQSVINQTYDNVEYIIIDGGSTDGTLDIIKKYEDKIDYWVSERDKGIYDAMNKGIDVASGDWINFMNAGDGLTKDNVIERIFYNKGISNADVIYGDTIVKYSKLLKKHIKPREILDFRYGLPFCHQSSIVKTMLHKKNKFSNKYLIYSDLDFFIKAQKEYYRFRYIEIPISVFDYTGISSSKTIRHYKELYYIYRNTNIRLPIIYFLNSFIREVSKKILPVKITNYIRKHKK